MQLAELAWLIPAFSFVAFFLVVAFGRFLPGKGSFVAILAIAAGFGMFWVVLAGYLGADLGADCADAFGRKTCTFTREWFTAGSVVLNWGIIVDPLAVMMLGMVTLVSLMIQVYSLGYMKGDPRFGWYFAFHALFVASMLTLVLADNFLLLYVVWELVGICSYLLIGFWYERRSATEAAKKAFITTRIGDVGLLVGILLLGREVGSLQEVPVAFDFDMSHAFDAVSTGAIGEGMATVVALLIFLGAMGKSAQFPFHVWLPDAMEGPTPVSALIHAATMVAAGVYLVARAFPIFNAAPDALIVVAVIGLVTTLMGASMALVVTDLKRILAYSTISHLGLMMLSLGAFGYTAAIFHLTAHGFSKALLFLGAGSVMHATEGETDIRKMGGLWRVMPFTAMAFTAGALSLAGIPLFAGFWSKDEILLAVLDHKNYLLAFALIAAFLSALYMARALYVVFYREPSNGSSHVHESPPVMILPMGVLAVLAVLFGFISIRITDAGGIGTFLFFEKLHDFEFNVGLGLGSIVLALAAFAFAWRKYMDRPFPLGALKARLTLLAALALAAPVALVLGLIYMSGRIPLGPLKGRLAPVGFALGRPIQMSRRISLEPWKARSAALMAALALALLVYVTGRISLGEWTARLAALVVKVVRNRYYVDELYQWVIDRIVLTFSGLVALFDRVVVNDRGVNGPADSIRRSGLNLRYHVTGRMYNYTLAMAGGAVILAVLWWVLST